MRSLLDVTQIQPLTFSSKNNTTSQYPNKQFSKQYIMHKLPKSGVYKAKLLYLVVYNVIIKYHMYKCYVTIFFMIV